MSAIQAAIDHPAAALIALVAVLGPPLVTIVAAELWARCRRRRAGKANAAPPMRTDGSG
jgi:hypothetical protein